MYRKKQVKINSCGGGEHYINEAIGVFSQLDNMLKHQANHELMRIVIKDLFDAWNKELEYY